MSRIIWGNNEDRIYELGLDQGVLYLDDGGSVAWNGLTRVDETTDFSTVASYMNGEKFIEVPVSGPFSGNLKAITYPDEFSEYDGYLELESGLSVGNQNKKAFSLCYRTLIGNADQGLSFGYKIHIWYNLIADSNTITRKTLDSNVDPILFSWNLSSIPEMLDGYLPTSHVILDSTRMLPEVLAIIEDALYGTDENDPELPSISELLEIIPTIIITNNGDGTWSAIGPDELITMLDFETFEITEVNAIYLDGDTYIVSST